MDSVSTVGNQQRTPTNSTYGTVPLAFGGGSALIETLQSSLKQRDGENHQLQWELSRLQSERNFLLSEVSSLTSQLEGVSFFFHYNKIKPKICFLIFSPLISSPLTYSDQR